MGEHPADDCTIGTCPMTLANFDYIPNLAGNVFYLALFGILLLSQIGMGLYWRTWGYLIGMTGGLVLEVVGYIGRVQLHYNPFPFDPFLEYLICLTIGPAFISAAIYICLGRIVTVYGENVSRLRPRTYTIIFVSCDLLSLILQAAGGAITSTADDNDTSQKGINIMIAGLSTQVVSLAIFMGLCIDLAIRIRRSPQNLNWSFGALRSTLKWKLFLISLAIATITIFIRSIFRVAELKDGFDGALANDEVTFMILEGAMMSIACICMTVFHPGYCFEGKWNATHWLPVKQQEQSEWSLQERNRDQDSPVVV
ncbi:hypothetical protein MW887_007153 [Aspergillus wentii]|nr:hypothetical protein MW887_007153 [Aspergillus wentii]